MYTITETKTSLYINKTDYEQKKNNYRYKDRCDMLIDMKLRKTRSSNIDGVMKTGKGYHIVLDQKYLKKFKARIRSGISLCNLLPSYYLREVTAELFPNKLLCTEWDTMVHPITTNEGDFYYSPHLDRIYSGETFEFDVFEVEDFTECAKTNKEIQTIKDIEERKRIEKMNTWAYSDTIIAVLKEAGVDTMAISAERSGWKHGNRAYVMANGKEAYNKLVTTAINYYINSIAKEHGFEVSPVKIAKNRNIDQYIPLFFFDELTLLDNNKLN